MKLSTRELVFIAIFGAIWGVVEITLGTVLKSLNIPISGVLLGAIGLLIALIGRIFVPKRGSILFIGIIAMLLKLFSLGGVVIGPMVGIFIEALIAEIVVSSIGSPSRTSFILAGSLGSAWSLIQPLVTGPLLFGRSFYDAWLGLINRGSQMLGISSNAIFFVILALFLVYLLAGGIAGWAAWSLGQTIHERFV